MKHVRILMAGDRSIIVEFGNVIDPKLYGKVAALNTYLKEHPVYGVIETIPTYRSLMITYNPLVLPYAALVDKVKEILKDLRGTAKKAKKVFTIPVCFQGDFAPDLDYVAQYHNTSTNKIIREFCAQDFLIYMIGFTPGFPYVGGVPDTLVTPRLASPRVEIPAGSVGIGGAQLGIYPIASPAGFQLVGNTPVSLYDPNREPNPVLLEAGAYIRFASIEMDEYEAIKAQTLAGTYVCAVKEEA